ncbi:MAG: hypothetical protein F6K45_26960, partial [Kamptonema sp. SIO1D9]|nr:hypothetical protein [Kamptonema sp. SIO1D9]
MCDENPQFPSKINDPSRGDLKQEQHTSRLSEKLNSFLMLEFPLHPAFDYDSLINSPHPIGIDEDYPEDLKIRIGAAAASYFKGDKNIDYTLRTIRKMRQTESNKPFNSNRLDRVIRRSCLSSIRAVSQSVQEAIPNTEHENVMGKYVFDITLSRIPYSADRAFAEADKGALFECLAISRMILEKVCWAVRIRNLEDAQEITAQKAQSAISAVKGVSPLSGRLYGWLSKHAHWHYDAHIKTIQEVEGYVLHASRTFKLCSYLGLICLTRSILEISEGL